MLRVLNSSIISEVDRLIVCGHRSLLEGLRERRVLLSDEDLAEKLTAWQVSATSCAEAP